MFTTLSSVEKVYLAIEYLSFDNFSCLEKLTQTLIEEGDKRIIANPELTYAEGLLLASLIENGDYERLPPYESRDEVESTLEELDLFMESVGIPIRNTGPNCNRFIYRGRFVMKPYYNKYLSISAKNYSDAIRQIKVHYGLATTKEN